MWNKRQHEHIRRFFCKFIKKSALFHSWLWLSIYIFFHNSIIFFTSSEKCWQIYSISFGNSVRIYFPIFLNKNQMVLLRRIYSSFSRNISNIPPDISANIFQTYLSDFFICISIRTKYSSAIIFSWMFSNFFQKWPILLLSGCTIS